MRVRKRADSAQAQRALYPTNMGLLPNFARTSDQPRHPEDHNMDLDPSGETLKRVSSLTNLSSQGSPTNRYWQSGYMASSSRPLRKIGARVKPPCRLIHLRIGAG
jgi:hypothetical protein